RQARAVKIFSEEPVVIQIDGDPHPDVLELDCTVLPGQLTVRTARSTQASTISTLMRGWTGRGAERRIMRVLRHTPPEELDAVLGEVDLEALVRSVDDHRRGPDHRSALLDLLVRERREHLSVPTLARLVHALHRGPTPRIHERAIRDVILSLGGADLGLFKTLTNTAGSHHDLDHLVFDDIGDDAVRAEILTHIAQEAAGYVSDDLRILCDIDDTVVSML